MTKPVNRRKDWASVRLGDHTTVKARLGWKGLKAEEYVEDGYIFLATPNLKASRIDFENVNYISRWRYDESPEIQLRVGDVLIVKDGSTLGISNYVRYLPRPTTVNGSIAVVRSESTLFPEFLYHFVNGDEFQELITLKKAGLGVPHLFQADLREFAVSLPPLPEQKKIARILTTLDNQIEKTEALIAKYQAIKQGMMHDLFTRGIDAHGRLRPPPSEAADLYKQSELGWIPKEWTSARLGSGITAIQYGTSAPSHSEAFGSCPVLRIPNIEQGQLQLNDLQYQTPSPFEIKCFGVSEGDILVIRTNGNPKIVGTCAIVTGHELPMLFASYLIRIRLNSSLIASSFLASFFPSARQLVRQDGGVTAPRAGRGRPGWPMAAHQLASAYLFLLRIARGLSLSVGRRLRQGTIILILSRCGPCQFHFRRSLSRVVFAKLLEERIDNSAS